MNQGTAPTVATPPAKTLWEMMTGYWVSQGIYVAAKLGIADLLKQGPRTAEDLAAASGSHAPSLYRLLRALASVGIFDEVTAGSFALTDIGKLLCVDAPQSMQPLAVMYGEEQYRAWGEVLYSVRTGEPAFDHLYGMHVFEYYAKNPEPAAVFNAAMTGLSSHLAAAVVASYDFAPYATVIDIGGGHGALLCHILRTHPGMRGVLFDRPHVVDSAAARVEAAGVSGRCQLVGGDFFDSVPRDGDAYILEYVLHDWGDSRSLSILQTLRRAMRADAKLLVVEMPIPPGNEPFSGKWIDLHMLVMAPGAKERTIAEYEKLFTAAGFKLARAFPTPAGASVIEAFPV